MTTATTTTTTVTVKNPTRSRKFGWGFTFGPADWTVYQPDAKGTLKQIAEARATNKIFNNRGGTYFAEALFYNGRRITAVNGYAGRGRGNTVALLNMLDECGPSVQLTLE